MPTYTVTNSNFDLTSNQQNKIAKGITKVHNIITGANTYFAQVIFNKIKKNNHLMGGKKVKEASLFLQCQIREGKPKETKEKIIADLKNILIKNSKNDGLDFMESNAVVENAKIYNSKDKGISIGEKSKVSIKNSSIIDNNIGIAVKDNSSSTIEKSNIENNNIQIAAYAKNWQYGNGGKVKVLYSKIRSKENNFNTNSDPDESDKSNNKDLIQNSEIELINSSIDGKVNVKGKNFTYNK